MNPISLPSTSEPACCTYIKPIGGTLRKGCAWKPEVNLLGANELYRRGRPRLPRGWLDPERIRTAFWGYWETMHGPAEVRQAKPCGEVCQMDAGAFMQFLSSRRAEINSFREKFGVGETDAIEAFYTAGWALQRYDAELESKKAALEAGLRELLPPPGDPRLDVYDPWFYQVLRWEALEGRWGEMQRGPQAMVRKVEIERINKLADLLRELDGFLPFDESERDAAFLRSVNKPEGRKDWSLRTYPSALFILKWWVFPPQVAITAPKGGKLEEEVLEVPLCLWAQEAVAKILGGVNAAFVKRSVAEAGLAWPIEKLITLSKDKKQIVRREKPMRRNRKH